jgi:polar amino acid transport system permease protein
VRQFRRIVLPQALRAIIPLLLVATVYYVLLTSILSIVQYYVERHYSRGALRTVAPTPFERVRAALREFREKATQR